ncbi:MULTISPECIES: NADH-quinone oxidoreductase subunit B family protein [unclassified Niveibacterium]|uniref:NADH-quinone oxidoreductase subunit B family protein n=1 Tax=unclassified Niveibacterium TaxID=2648924 RepID=UPI001553AFBC|nr:NADH-quinone oxidoreductase subunit B family protein [Niveibacterium sp. COAC-50]
MNKPIEFAPRNAQGMPTPISESEHIAQLKQTLLGDIKRSAYVYRVDCGGCNGCEIEIFSAITPVFDAERFGIKVVASPRHADILLFTGAVTRSMRMPAIRAYRAAPDPKIVVSYGACGCSGGIFHDLYCVWGGTDQIVPVDVFIPGCPPTPAATIYGFAVALGLLNQKLKGSHHQEAEGEVAQVRHPDVPLDLRVLIEREARRMAGYLHGGRIADDFMGLMVAAPTPEGFVARAREHLAAKDDPRLSEIFAHLQSTCLGIGGATA